MRQSHVTVLAAIAAAILGSTLPISQVHAATMSPAGSATQAYFGSQGTAYTASDPTGPSWTPSSPAPVTGYPAGAPIAGVPTPPAAVPPVYPPLSGPNAFQPAPWASTFNDGFGAPTTAKSVIGTSYNPSPTLTSDASIVIPFWNLTQAGTAPSFAYEQINFAADFLVSGGTLGASTPTLPMAIGGTVVGGSTNFAEFDATLNYTWTDINSAGTFGTVTSLGTLTYFYLQSGGGSFGTTLTSTGSLIATPTSGGMLEITGYMWVAGDPFEIDVESLPEPTSLGLLALGGIAMLRRRRPSNICRA